jgi:hypothetical protein
MNLFLIELRRTAPSPYIEIGKRAIKPASMKEAAPGRESMFLYFVNTPQRYFVDT